MDETFGPVDLVLLNAEFYQEADGVEGWAGAVAVHDSKIVAIGSAEELRHLIGPQAEVVDLEGATVFPGFIDAHVHPMSGGAVLLQCSLGELSDREEYLGAVEAYAQTLSPGEWITGGGWSMAAFERGVPDAESLDTVSGRHPALLYNRDTHSAWVNTATLKLAGIDADTPDPVGGRIERDSSGEPTGALHETAMDLAARFIPPPAPDHHVKALRAGVHFLNRLGVTGWQDAKVRSEDLAAYLALQDAGELSARVAGAYWLDPQLDVEQVDEIVAHRESVPAGGRFSLTSVKIMLDGVCETFTANMSSPYLDGRGNSTRNTGIKFFDTDLLRECARRLDAAGFQMHFHAVGDAAVTEALDTVAAVREANGPSPNRPHVAHVQVVRPNDIPRFRSLGVSVNAQPLWARLEPQMTELTLPFLGPTRGRWQYPFGDLESAGATIAIGSDWPVSTPDPIQLLHVAVNRTPVPGRTTWVAADGVFLPDQRLSLPVALRAYTRHSAWLNRHEGISGSLAIGKSADFAVMDTNPFSRPRQEIWRSQVVQTWFSGQRIA